MSCQEWFQKLYGVSQMSRELNNEARTASSPGLWFRSESPVKPEFEIQES